MHVLFLACKHKVQSGITPSLFFAPTLLAVITSLKNASPEEVMAAYNKHYQDQANIHFLLTLSHFLMANKTISGMRTMEYPALQLSGSKLSFSLAVLGPSLTSP